MIRTLWIGDRDLQGRVLGGNARPEAMDGIEINQAADLSDGLKILSHSDPDVILLDLTIPDGNGLKTFIKLYESASNTPVIIIINRNDVELAVRAVKEGACDYLIMQEINDQLLAKAVHYSVERNRLESELKAVRGGSNVNLLKRIEELEKTNSDLKSKLAEGERAQEDLAKSERRYRKIVEEITYLIYYTTDINGYATYVNQPCAEITGYSMEELAGIHYLELIRPDWREKGEAFYRNQFKNRIRETTMNWPINTKSGEVKWIEQKVQLLMSDGYVHGFQGVGRDITDQKRAEDKLRAALMEKEVLLKEIHHRMKNNLLAISGLLHFQEASIKDDDSRRVLTNCQKRIMSMAVIHEKLYQMEDLANVNIGDYIRTLANNLVGSFSLSPDDITIDIPIHDVKLNLETAVPCGLIITELITNALEYAFSGTGKGTITVDLKELPGRKFILTVSDDGIGLPDDLDIGKTKTLGLLLARTLIDSLGGTMEIDRKRGSTFRFEFKEYSEGRVEPIADLSPPD